MIEQCFNYSIIHLMRIVVNIFFIFLLNALLLEKIHSAL